MPKNTTNKENPLLSKNIPRPPVQQDINSTVENSKEVIDGNRQQYGNTVIPQQTVKQQTTVKREKITFYLEPVQAEKLYELMEQFRRKTGVKINQQNILRRIIETANIDTVLP